MTKFRDAVILFAAIIMTAPQILHAAPAPTQWAEGVGGNGHYYEVISAPGLSWADANAMASDMFFTPPGSDTAIQGHLATIDSDGENTFVYYPLPTTAQYWLGGFQQPGSGSIGAGWQWVNVEGPIPTSSFPVTGVYSNWLGGEPNDGDGVENDSENWLTIGIGGGSLWNDSLQFSGNGGFIVEYDGIADAEDCNPCNPSGVQEVDLPDDIVLPPDATIAQTLIRSGATGDPLETVKLTDPRVNANGECVDRRYLDVFGDPGVGTFDPSLAGKLILPPWLCGSPEFAVLQSELNFDILDDVVRSRQLPEEIFGMDTFPCDIDAVLGDLQTRGVFAWQTDDRNDLIEGRALELTNACGSRRGATRGGSFFVLNLHIDCGIPFGSDDTAVLACFIDLTNDKFASLDQSLKDAKKKLISPKYGKLRSQFASAWDAYQNGNYAKASQRLGSFISRVDNASFDSADGFNYQGNLLMRAENIKFIIDEKINP